MNNKQLKQNTIRLKNQIKQIGYVVVFALLLGIQSASAQVEWEKYSKIVELRGMWRFEIGDDMAWADPEFDDSKWVDIFVPASWEDEGFPGYDGIAWYRNTFQMPTKVSKSLTLFLGYIDDADEVYLNGHLIGFSGEFSTDKNTAYDKFREYRVPFEYFNKTGENVLAVRVFDRVLKGGIVGGKVGIYSLRDEFEPEVSLEGYWQFQTIEYDLPEEHEIDHSRWEKMFVPAYWDLQGYRDYDGFAWYRKEVVIPKHLENERLILLLGKIDDFDEAYINHQRIGRTGFFSRHLDRHDAGGEYAEDRAYYIPGSVIKFGEKNIIDVRVWDGQIDGGIYDGPVGIVTRKKYQRWKRLERGDARKSIWDILRNE